MRKPRHPWRSTVLLAALLAPLSSATDNPTCGAVAAGALDSVASPRVQTAVLDESSPDTAAEDVAALDTVESILDEYDAAYDAYRAAIGAAETDEERSAAYETYPQPETYGPRLIAVAKRAPGADEALEALNWVFQRGAAGDQQAECLDLVKEHHIDNDEAGAFCYSLSRSIESDVEQFLSAMAKESKSQEVLGNATYALAGVLGSRANLGKTLSTADEAKIEQYQNWYSPEGIKLALNSDPADLLTRREALLVTASTTYAMVQLRGRTLGQAAEADLFELRNLQVGKVAPDIVGDDLDGVEFKLSDYRGKVVFLDFWGDW